MNYFFGVPVATTYSLNKTSDIATVGLSVAIFYFVKGFPLPSLTQKEQLKRKKG
jgi:hypothetical protein